MVGFSLNDVGLKVGLEIHQQLDTDRKLFCECKPIESDEHPIEFHRILRTSKGELGEYDPAALFEKSKSKTITYYGNPQSSCLVEQDEEPPHPLDACAKEIAIMIASALNSSVFGEIYPMRKTVVDGSNTTGFQRTMLISQGGFYTIHGKKIGIQSVCLEEDAAKILGDSGNVRRYSLERLGIPLIEIATEPFDGSPAKIKDIALGLGRILRSTRKVRRGLGSIRQDVNVSIRDGGNVVEVKGVQQLDQLRKVVEYEAKRQWGLLQISRELADRKLGNNPDSIDVTHDARSWDSKIVREALKNKHVVTLMIFGDMAGMFGREYAPGIRLGRDLAEMVRFFGLGGVFHSDELPAYGIKQEDMDRLTERHSIGKGDGFLLLACPPAMSDVVTGSIFARMTDIRDSRVPRDTRMATQTGETRFLRPRPGAARMYPETDIPPITVSEEELLQARESVPKSWDESIAELQSRFGINAQLAGQVLDSRYEALFERIASNTGINPTFVASTLCSSITGLERGGLDSKLLKDSHITEAFDLLREEKIAKESIEMIFEDIMAGRSENIADAMKNASVRGIDSLEMEHIIRKIVDENPGIIKSQKERAAGPLMGIVMKELRGKAPGETVSRILLKMIKEKLDT